MTVQRFRFFTACALCATLFAVLLSNTALAMDGVRRGLSLCSQTLIPALFPFLVLSELFVACGAGDALGRVLGRPIAALFGLSQGGACAVLLGALCGQPVATTAACSLFERGEIGQAELERISLFANNPSSAFLTAAVGSALFGNASAGMALFVITLLASATVGAGLRIFGGKTGVFQKKPPNGARKTLCVTEVTAAIKRAFFTLLQVCAFLLFFCALSACLSAPLTETAPIWRVLLCGILEITGGISAAATMLTPALAFRLTAFFASFAGLSVCLQILSITEGKGVRISHYLAAKFVQGGIALALCEAYLYFFRPTLSPTASVPTGTFAGSSPFLVILLLLLVLAIFIIELKRKSQKKYSE